MPGAAVVGGAALVVALPVLVVVLSVGSSSAASPGGFGQGLRPGSVPAPYVPLVEEAGGLCAAAPPSVIAAQIETESGWNPNAVSSAGAEGISQFMPGTWPSWSAPGQSPFDPAAAIPAQGRFDCALAVRMQTWQTAGLLPAAATLTGLMLAGYNAGAGAVLAAGGIPQNGQTPAYVSLIMTRAAFYADTTGQVTATGFAGREITAAEAEVGLPYVWGGGTWTGPTGGGFDCSGLVMFAVYQASAGALRFPHSAATQTTLGTRLPTSQLEPGDLIGFTNPGEGAAHHIGIYVGNDEMVDAPSTGEFVRIESLASSYWESQIWTVTRVAT